MRSMVALKGCWVLGALDGEIDPRRPTLMLILDHPALSTQHSALPICEIQPAHRIPSRHLDLPEPLLDVHGDRGGVGADLQSLDRIIDGTELDAGVQDPGGIEALLHPAEERHHLGAIDPLDHSGAEPAVAVLAA